MFFTAEEQKNTLYEMQNALELFFLSEDHTIQN